MRDWSLGHGETNSELSSCDKAGSEAIKVSEEFADTDSLLLAELTNSSDHIVDVVRIVADDLSVGVTSLGLGEVGLRVVESLVNAKELL